MKNNSNSFFHEYRIIDQVKNLTRLQRGEVSPPPDTPKDQYIKKRSNEILDYLDTLRETFSRLYSEWSEFSNQELEEVLRKFKKSLNALPADLRDQAYKEWRLYLTDAIESLEDELSNRNVLGQSGTESERMREQIRTMIEIVADLEKDCEVEVKKHPDQERMIRKIYRQAIDRVRGR